MKDLMQHEEDTL